METESTATTDLDGEVAARAPEALHLVVLWSKHEPHRIGECSTAGQSALLGRGASRDLGDPPKLEFFRKRPGELRPTGYLEGPTLSRRQWLLEGKPHSLQIRSIGRRPLLHNGSPVDACSAADGDTIGVEGVILFLVERRPLHLPRFEFDPFDFGGPDRAGLVGESPVTWELRHRLWQLGQDRSHVLIFGESGTGKELAARAIHGSGARVSSRLISRNAATIPAALVEAELFGNAANYPNSGMAARPGLIGAADGGDLFLDEIGELGETQQASLLRVLDAGEYQRLGEERVRSSRFRLIAATNRPPNSLKADFLARFPERITLPTLAERRSDIPLIAAHLVHKIRQGAPTTFSGRLIEALVHHEYPLQVRELERLLRVAARRCSGDLLDLCDELCAELQPSPLKRELDAESIRAALAESKSVAEAAKRLELPSRYALYRLMRKLGIVAD